MRARPQVAAPSRRPSRARRLRWPRDATCRSRRLDRAVRRSAAVRRGGRLGRAPPLRRRRGLQRHGPRPLRSAATACSALEYEAYEEQAAAPDGGHRRRGPRPLARARSAGRCSTAPAPVPLGDSAVVVVASAPHRGEAFDAARFAIDALKATVPIWKRETWDGGESWGLEAQHLVELDELDERSALSEPGREQRRRSCSSPSRVSVAGSFADLGAQPQAQDVHVEHRRLLPRDEGARPRHRRAPPEPSPQAHRPAVRAAGRASGQSPASTRRAPGATVINGPAGPPAPADPEEQRPWLATSPSISAPPTPWCTRGARASCLNEPSVIALNSRTQDVLAMGHEAWQMIGRTPSYIVAVRPAAQGRHHRLRDHPAHDPPAAAAGRRQPLQPARGS